ncbi:MAG TPA: hypothetical protein VNJ54_08045, partial [Plantibacter sp.]|nr:hypothetical protein [Plantibacter sp.]
HDREIHIEDDEIGCVVRDRPERGISAAHYFDDRVAGAFERMLDQSSDILLVFNYEDTGHPTHRLTAYAVKMSLE